MPLNYRDLLDNFAASLISAADASAGLTDATYTRLSVYRNNVRLNRIDALTDAFTHVVMLVGIDYFRALARAYVIATPAASANLHDDGADLPAFLRSFAPAADLPYLGDVAEVDWLMQRAYHASDSTPLDRTLLTQLNPERFAAASLQFVPSVGVANSAKWPIADIIAMHEGGPKAVLDTGGQAILVWREGFTVRWRAISGNEACALAALLRDSHIEDVLTRTTYDLNPLLVHLFSHGLIHAIEETDRGKH
jgi:hypothetical protein